MHGLLGLSVLVAGAVLAPDMTSLSYDGFDRTLYGISCVIIMNSLYYMHILEAGERSERVIWLRLEFRSAR